MKKIKWNKRKFLNNIKELILGTAFFTIPTLACLVYGFGCNLLGL